MDVKDILSMSFFSQSMDQLIENTVPVSIRMQRSIKMDDPVCKFAFYFSHYWKNLLRRLRVKRRRSRTKPDF